MSIARICIFAITPMDLYAQNILDHYKNPHNKGRISGKKVSRKEANYSCGDTLNVDLVMEKGVIINMKFFGGGCAISQAAMSILSDEVIGMKVSEVLELTQEDIEGMLGVPITYRRAKCAILGLLTTKNAILKDQKKELLSYTDVVEE